ncbi:DNA replication factor C complex subunit Rfc1 [Polyrhizophydium stewartii]|uniref:DNA replication factor C complex subunit Rfc1 n=1 Tax=Polyrhizophydium stewartii TaxID=2732419 RepID=A0ABR4N2U6_9FUNG
MSKDIRSFFLRPAKGKAAGPTLAPPAPQRAAVDRGSASGVQGGTSHSERKTKRRQVIIDSDEDDDNHRGEAGGSAAPAAGAATNRHAEEPLHKRQKIPASASTAAASKADLPEVAPSAFFSSKINRSSQALTTGTVAQKHAEDKNPSHTKKPLSSTRAKPGASRASIADPISPSKNKPAAHAATSAMDVDEDLNDEEILAAVNQIEAKYAEKGKENPAVPAAEPKPSEVAGSARKRKLPDFNQYDAAPSTAAAVTSTAAAAVKAEADESDKTASRKKPVVAAPAATSPVKQPPKTPTKASDKTPTKAMSTSPATSPAGASPSAPKTKAPSSSFGKYLAKKAAGPRALGSRPLPVGAENCLAGLSFVFTGEVPSFERDQMTDLVKRYGGRVMSAPSSKTSYVVVGNDPGESKLKKIKQHNIKTLDEDSFCALIVASLPPGSSGSGSGSASGSASNVSKPQTAPPTASAKSASAAPAAALPASSKLASSATAAGSTGSAVRAFGPGSASIVASKPRPVPVVSRPSSGSTELWTDKYKPQRYDEVIGNKGNIEKLAAWLNQWDTNRHNGFPKGGKDDISQWRACLISGPPGLGKTTSAHLVARLEGFEAIEFNASDTRSKKALDEHVRELTGTVSLSSMFGGASGSASSGKGKVWFPQPTAFALDSVAYAEHQAPAGPKQVKGKVLIMDEVDGMSAGDRGGSAELIQIIKKTKVPIICICNDRSSPKIRSLANHCLDLRFRRPTAQQIEARLRVICGKERLELRPNVIGELVESASADIRQILNTLSTYRLTADVLTFDDSKDLAKRVEKNCTMTPFDLIGKLLSRMTFRSASMNEKIDWYFQDYSIMPLMVHENYMSMRPSIAQESGKAGKQGDFEALRILAEAADSISIGDLVESVQRRENNWGLLPVHAVMSTVRPAFFAHGTSGGRYNFAGWLGQNSKQSKTMRLLREIQIHMRLKISGDKTQLRQQYLPALAPILVQPLVARGADGVNDTIALMDEYFISKDDFDSIMELGFSSLVEKLPAATKSAFTRQYNKGTHPTPILTTITSKVKATSVGGPVPDSEDVLDADDAVADADASGDDGGSDQDDDAITGDRAIKVKKAAGASSAGKAASSRSGSSSATVRICATTMSPMTDAEIFFASMKSLYLLRNHITRRVLVSPSLRLDSRILNQIGEHRPQNKIRPDHWVPFLAVTGFKSDETVQKLQDAIAPPRPYFEPKLRLPLKGSHVFTGWSVPEAVKESTVGLCRELEASAAVLSEIYGAEAVARAIEETKGETPAGQIALSDVAAEQVVSPAAAERLRTLAPAHTLTMWWERDEFRYLVDDAGLLWPEFVAHEKLRLHRGRYPIWPKRSGITESVF